uniref:FERM and PDZ domain-containing protein 1 n=1 Tax=Pyxicephalus adspersus TaxID=30357 RepID=A0AAV3AUN1_PYXAD|nr:TPA: hypothetical protein GDO54_008629 [Pyxicephalus adspersus]
MEDPDTHLLQIRKGHRIEQMVVRWLRRSRDNSSRTRVSTGDSPSVGPNQYGCSLKLTLEINKDPYFENYGFDIAPDLPLTVTVVNAGGPAEGKLLLGDQICAINNENVENTQAQKASDMISPKSSFLTAEKRARLKSNPVKVRFAEEVIVNGHTQGNSLLFMPNVLKVYLENGQTKAFKFEKKTTVKDIVMTLKEKLSINIIEHFALALEEQYNISKLYLLHEEELIEQVVQKRESHDYRCLFRVCFVPKDPLDLLQEDPVAFEYLYLQSCSDVLQERFAMEMKCSVALRLAALHIQERIHTCGQSQKISFKYIEKDWGIDNFLSPTLLRNMRGKDIKKAISFHIKRNQCILEPRQKQPVSAAQIRLQYLKILGDLKTYGGKIFNATLMLQDRESYVTLLVGAKYGISQIINNKLNIMITLAEFSNISRIELTPESEKVSLVKVYLQDVKPLSLLLESNNAKDIACLISGYCKLLTNSAASIFEWCPQNQVHRISTEEGYESRACSDSEESSELDSSLDLSSELQFLRQRNIKPLQEEEEEEEEVEKLKQDKDAKESTVTEEGHCDCKNNDTDSISEASDSANTESHGYKISWSSDSIDALEEDDLETCSSSRPEFFQFYTPILNDENAEDQGVFTDNLDMKCKGDGCEESDPLLCFLQMSNTRENSIIDSREKPRSPKDADCREDYEIHVFPGCQLTENNIMEYYSLCSNVSPASSVDRNIPSSPESNCVNDLNPENKEKEKGCRMQTNNEVDALILDPPPGFGDSSSEEEFFDATDRFTPTLTSPGVKSENAFVYPDKSGSNAQNSGEKCRKEKQSKKPSKIRKRRSYLQTDYTSQVTFPMSPSNSLENMDHVCCFEKESHLPAGSHSPTVSSLKDIEAEPALLETKPLLGKPILKSNNRTHSPSLMEMEPDTMETKSVTESVSSCISAIRFPCDSGVKERSQNGKYCVNGCNNADKIPNCNISEQNDRASPSQISLELDNTGVYGLSHVSLVPDNQNVVRNVCKNDTVMEENIDSMLSPVLSDRMLPYISETEASHQSKYNILLNELTNSEGDVSPKGEIINESSPQSSKTRKLFFDLKGIADIFTSFPINSFKDGGTEVTKVPRCEESVHLLTNEEPDYLMSVDPTDVKRNFNQRRSCLSSSVRSSETAVDTLELCYEENDERIDSCAETISSDEGFDGNSLYKENCISEAQTFIPRCADSSTKGFRQKEVLESRCVDLYITEQRSPKNSKEGNCSCHLSYTNCFRPIDNDAEDEIIDFAGTVSPLPRTIPPRSGNSFVENNHLSSITNSQNSPSLEHCEALDLLRARIHNSPMGFGKLQDIVLDLQKILEEYKKKQKPHPEDRCAGLFSEQKSSLCTVSRNVMSASQKVLRPNQTSEEIYQAVEETFFNLVHMTDFVQAARKAADREDQELHLKLLSRQCTALTAAIFCLTQQFRTLITL